MTSRPDRRIPPAVQPVIYFDKPKADAAYEAHCALVEMETRRPVLAHNPYWNALRDSAHARFRAAFEAAD